MPERTIKDIVEKVTLWRKLYNGDVQVENADGVLNVIHKKGRRCGLIEGARKLGISKKSMDDYLLQLRFGRKFGFNFDLHRNERVGILRAFVKEKKDQEKMNNGNQKLSSKLPRPT
jgi:hypothetical protein